MARMRFIGAMFILLGVIGLSPALADKNRMEVGSATGEVLVGPALPEKIKARDIVSIKVLQVRNVRGNNPIKPDQPVNNLDGRSYETLRETLAALTGVTPAAPGGTCTGTVAMAQSVYSPGDHRFASLDLDPNTGQCRRVRQDSDGSTLIIQTPPAQNPGFAGAAYPNTMLNIWRITPPPPDYFGDGVRLLNNTQYPITLESTAGVRVQVTLRIIHQGGVEYNLEITDLRRL